MKVVYVAGPFRGPDHWAIAENIRNAERLALEVWRLGAACLCPHANTAHFQNAAPDDVWLDGDLEMLSRCDAVLMTPDWERSSGARAEHEFAKQRGIPAFYCVGSLARWVSRAAEPVTDVNGVVMTDP